jgi:multidrug resistance efflux pump
MSKQKIHTPAKIRFRLWRQRVLPFLVWVLAVGVVLFLSARQPEYIDALGVVEPRVVSVSPVFVGAVQSISVDIFDEVASGDPVALMDNTLVTAELVTAEAELARLRLSIEQQNVAIEATAAAQAVNEANDLRRYIVNEDIAQLDYLDRLVQQETDRVSLQRLEVLFAEDAGLLAGGAIGSRTYAEALFQRDVLETKVRENEAVLALAKEQYETTSARRVGFEASLPSGLPLVDRLIPLSEELAVQEARINEIRERRRLLVLRSPLSGKVASINRRSGETVMSGEAILTIVDSVSTRVLAYVNEEEAHNVHVGDTVEVFPHSRSGQAVKARVAKIASQIEELPIRIWRSPIQSQWGLPILIDGVSADQFFPGEMVDIRLMLGP